MSHLASITNSTNKPPGPFSSILQASISSCMLGHLNWGPSQTALIQVSKTDSQYSSQLLSQHFPSQWGAPSSHEILVPEFQVLHKVSTSNQSITLLKVHLPITSCCASLCLFRTWASDYSSYPSHRNLVTKDSSLASQFLPGIYWPRIRFLSGSKPRAQMKIVSAFLFKGQKSWRTLAQDLWPCSTFWSSDMSWCSNYVQYI